MGILSDYSSSGAFCTREVIDTMEEGCHLLVEIGPVLEDMGASIMAPWGSPQRKAYELLWAIKKLNL